jgi:hypothetical protein
MEYQINCYCKVVCMCSRAYTNYVHLTVHAALRFQCMHCCKVFYALGQ